MLALTGTTGALGSLLLPLVADLAPRLVVRDAARAPRVATDAGLEVRVADYDDVDAATTALEGVETLFMVSAGESRERVRTHAAFVEAAARAGVRHVVYTSFAGAAPDATFTLGRDHHATEELLRGSGMATTMLRDSFYLDLLPLFADAEGVLRGPAGEGRVAGVARADVADVAATVLRDPDAHAGAAYALTGPEALTFGEVAARAGAVLGRELRFVDETVDEAYASRRAAYPDAADWQLDAWVSTYTAIADGSVAAVSDDVARLTGRPARTLEESLRG